VAALVVAAGAGERFGGPLPKVFVPLAGRPMLAWAVRAFAAHPEIDDLAVVVAPEQLARARELCGEALIVAGGAHRRQSVLNGLRALADLQPELVAIHDGARPLVTAAVISDSLRVCREHGAALTAVPATDTVKQVEDGRIIGTLDRRRIHLAQTPQTFCFDLILQAHERADAEGWEVTDDAMLLERLGHPVYTSSGDTRNLKITTRADLLRAEALLRGEQTPHVGHGLDVHRLVAGRRLILGGVAIPHDKGLLGHSDADAALHAIADALLGACGLGDIGRLFPDTDAQYQDADSVELLRQVVGRVAQAGWRVGNVDVTIIAQEPRLAPHVENMRAATAEALGVDLTQVSYKATTTEKLGPIGEGRAIAAEAVALLVPVRP
jgi:2-C-methyl-D-erythritol 4-phosphate cytidylyltransferase/2-C-methyl-D-erythritol 2,4-cyclodiphosphate synthase